MATAQTQHLQALETQPRIDIPTVLPSPEDLPQLTCKITSTEVVVKKKGGRTPLKNRTGISPNIFQGASSRKRKAIQLHKSH